MTAVDVRGVYDRVARFYDVHESVMDAFGGRRRRRRVIGEARGRVLEVGIGTGRNLDLYDAGVQLVGVDLSGKMLARAARRATSATIHAALVQGDAQQLPFLSMTFDMVTATCVFCSVSDPLAGLAEVARVLRPGGKALLLEHVRPRTRLLGWLFDALTPLTRRLIGPEINRRTEDSLRTAGFRIVQIRRRGVWREIESMHASRPEADLRSPGDSAPGVSPSH